MRRGVLAAAAAALLTALATPPAAAAADSRRVGECAFSSFADRLNLAQRGPMTWRGEIDVQMAVYSPGRVLPPVSATVTCWIKVNGVDQPGARLTVPGTGVVAGAGVVRFDTASPFDSVDLCMEVDYTSDDTPTESFCYERIDIQVPPSAFGELAEEYADPVLCAVAGGDVGMREVAYYDCPPYGT